MHLTIILLAILLYQIVTFGIIFIAKNTYRDAGKLTANNLAEQIEKLVEANCNGVFVISSSLSKKIKLIKKQNETRWWIELFGKEEVLDKIKFHLKYNEAYRNFVSSEYHIKYNSLNQEGIFLGHKQETMDLILQKLVTQYYDANEKVFYRNKNIRPSNSLSENEV